MEDMEMVNAGFTRENTLEDERGGAWAELPGMMTPAQPAKKKAKKASLSVVGNLPLEDCVGEVD
jgi:hypothetical protein